MSLISRTRITSAARSPVAKQVIRCLIGCALAAVSVALDHPVEPRATTERGDCA